MREVVLIHITQNTARENERAHGEKHTAKRSSTRRKAVGQDPGLHLCRTLLTRLGVCPAHTCGEWRWSETKRDHAAGGAKSVPLKAKAEMSGCDSSKSRALSPSGFEIKPENKTGPFCFEELLTRYAAARAVALCIYVGRQLKAFAGESPPGR